MHNKLIENIFSVKADYRYKIITVLFLKIKFKTLNKRIFYSWKMGGTSKELMGIFSSISAFRWMFVPRKIWLVYLSCLIESDKEAIAKKFLKKYLKKFGESGIENFLPVAKLASSVCPNNEKIKKSARVFELFAQSKRERVLEDLIRDKSVAIVGNGPSEVGKSRGAEIDSHEIVVRFNNYKTDGFEKDYGSKTDIWMKASASDIIHKPNDTAKIILYESDFMHHPIEYSVIDVILTHSQPVRFFDFSEHKRLFEMLGTYPSTGLVFIENVLKLSPKSVDFYGFQFLQEIQDGLCTHYFGDRTKAESFRHSNVHNFIKESDYIRELLNDNSRENIT